MGRCESAGLAQDVPRHLRQVAVQQRTAARIFLEHAEHLGVKRAVVTTGGFEERPALGLRELRRLKKEALNSLEPGGVHAEVYH